MLYIIIVFFIIAFLFIIDFIKNKAYIKSLRNSLLNSYGKENLKIDSKDKIKIISKYYNLQAKDKYYIDHITWNDLDMDEIFLKINHTSSSLGEEFLYSMLHKPLFDNDGLNNRNDIINFFDSNQDTCLLIQIELARFGKLTNISLYEYINKLSEVEKTSNVKHYLMATSLLLSFAFLFIKPSLFFLFFLLTLSNNIISYYKNKAHIEEFLITISYILKLLNLSNRLSKNNISIIKPYEDILKDTYNKYKKFKKGAFVLTGSNLSGSILDIVLDYFRMLFHIDLIKFNKMIKIFKNNENSILNAYEAIGFIDGMIAIASYRRSLKNYCIPKLDKSYSNIEVKKVYHPFISKPITNSIKETDSVLITGSNASGKSTFLKTLAINTLLSQTIYTSLSESYRAGFFYVMSQMALKDNIFNNESYYIVEIKSLKRIIDKSKGNVRVLCFIDEVLRGTNTLERIAASSRILKELSTLNAVVFAATHDIELTSILKENYKNYHFREQIIENDIYFDYKLYKGSSKTRNAIKLLEILGYDNKIIDDANLLIDYFMNNNKWTVH